MQAAKEFHNDLEIRKYFFKGKINPVDAWKDLLLSDRVKDCYG